MPIYRDIVEISHVTNAKIGRTKSCHATCRNNNNNVNKEEGNGVVTKKGE